MRHVRIVRIVLVVCVVLGTAASWADVVELKTAERVEGTFKRATPAGVVIEVGGRTITFEQKKVRAIYFGSAAPAPVQFSARDEALKALKGLRSVTRGGVSYREYASRVTDAKIVADRYLEQPERDDAAPRAALEDAMNFYVFVASIWNSVLTEGYADRPSLTTDPVLARCPPAHRAMGGGVVNIRPRFDEGLRGFWSCASDRITEAEKLMAESQKN